jgi:hypothetical protein
MSICFDDPVKQEIWTTLRALNDCWTKGNPDELVNFFHRNMVAITPNNPKRVDGGSECVAGWKGFAKAAHIQRWEEIDPVIHVYGNAAVVVYYYDMSFEMKGPAIHLSGRDMFFFVKEDEKWWVVADQFSSTPD